MKRQTLPEESGCPSHGNASAGSARSGERHSGKLAAAGKVFRVAAAVTVFGIPLLVGTVAVIGYGVHEAYKALKRR